MSEPRSKLSTFEQRVDWLLKHQELWIKWFTADKTSYLIPVLGSDPSKLLLGRRNLFLAMQRDGLFSKSTYWLDCKLYHELIAAKKVISDFYSKRG